MVSIFAIIAPLGLPSILIREIVKDKQNTNQYVTTAIGIRLAAGLVFYALMIGISYLLNYRNVELVLISIIGSKIFLQSFDSIENYLQASVKLRTSSKVRMIALVLVSAVKLYLIFTKAPLVHFAYAYIIEFTVISLLFIYLYYKMRDHTWQFQFSGKTARSLLIHSLPLVYYSALLTINMKVDQIMITKLLDNEANGYYSVVVALIETLYFIPVALGTSLFPGLIKQHQVKKESHLDSFQLLYEVMLVVSIGIAIVFSIGAPIIVGILYGPEFKQSVPLLQIYSLCPVLMFYGYIRSRWLIIENLQRLSVWFLAVALVVNIGLNFYLLPRIGLQGAIIALLASYVTSFIIVPYIIPSTRISVIMFFRAFRFRRISEVIKNRAI